MRRKPIIGREMRRNTFRLMAAATLVPAVFTGLIGAGVSLLFHNAAAFAANMLTVGVLAVVCWLVTSLVFLHAASQELSPKDEER